MFISLRRYLAQNINVMYDDDNVPVSVEGCNSDFTYIKKFCEEILQDPGVFEMFLEDISASNGLVTCDCAYLLETDLDYIITDGDSPPMNPN
jgi:hypothetical protein